MWGVSSNCSTGNSALEIGLRQKKAAITRERLRIGKAYRASERSWSQNLRKLGTLQRSLQVLMGRDPYPNCPREETLFEYNQPGFCYKRDGKPRYLRSLQESKSRKILNDLDGRNGIISPEPAINVVSDTPQMAEVLSSPELVHILCELRNTAAIMSDELLFLQFARALRNSSRDSLALGFNGPLDYLKQYRKNLIQEFFDTLNTEAEMHFFLTQDNLGRYKSKPSKLLMFSTNEDSSPPASDFKLKSDTVDAGAGSMGSRRSTRMATATATTTELRDIEKWNQAVIDGLRRAQRDESKRKLVEGKRGTSRKDEKTEAAAAAAAATTTKQAANKRFLSPASKKQYQRQQKRREFDRFVRHLISKVEVLGEMSQRLLAFRKKRPNQQTFVHPLVKLLRKQSLFSSLTDEDIRLALNNKLNEPQQENGGDPSVGYFKIPSSGSNTTSRTDMPSSSLVAVKPANTNAFSNDLGNVASLGGQGTTAADDTSGSPRVQSALNVLEFGGPPTRRVHFNTAAAAALPFEDDSCDALNEAKCLEGSVRKIVCKACREKVKLACTKMQTMDSLRTRDTFYWKVPEISSWSHDEKSKSLEESLRNVNERLSKDRIAKTVYLVPPPTFLSAPKGAPTPRFPRRSFAVVPTFPRIKAEESFMGIPIRVLTGEDISTDGRGQSKSRVGGGSSHTAEAGNNNNYNAASKRSPPLDSWTLEVSKMDIMRLRHELETESVKDRMADFDSKLLNNVNDI